MQHPFPVSRQNSSTLQLPYLWTDWADFFSAASFWAFELFFIAQSFLFMLCNIRFRCRDKIPARYNFLVYGPIGLIFSVQPHFELLNHFSLSNKNYTIQFPWILPRFVLQTWWALYSGWKIIESTSTKAPLHNVGKMMRFQEQNCTTIHMSALQKVWVLHFCISFQIYLAHHYQLITGEFLGLWGHHLLQWVIFRQCTFKQRPPLPMDWP